MSISYLNRKHPGNEITVVCHSSPQGKVYSSPHLNQVLCASEFDLILQMVLQLGKWWRQQENPSHALPTPAASLCSGFVSKINFHGFGRGENHYRKDKNNVFDFFFFSLVHVIGFYPPRRLMFKMNNGQWGVGRGEELKGSSCLPFSQLMQCGGVAASWYHFYFCSLQCCLPLGGGLRTAFSPAAALLSFPNISWSIPFAAAATKAFNFQAPD